MLSSAGWYIDRDRTIRITGGPRAAIEDGLLVIETDTTVPFTLVDETGKTVAVGNQDGAEAVPEDETGEDDDLDDTEDAAKLNPPVGSTLAMGIGSATAAAAGTGGAPVLQAEGRQQEKTKDGFWMRTLKAIRNSSTCNDSLAFPQIP